MKSSNLNLNTDLIFLVKWYWYSGWNEFGSFVVKIHDAHTFINLTTDINCYIFITDNKICRH